MFLECSFTGMSTNIDISIYSVLNERVIEFSLLEFFSLYDETIKLKIGWIQTKASEFDGNVKH